MKRDPAKFPDDENGDVLWQLHSQGDDLTQPREVNFYVVFTSEESAEAFAADIVKAGYQATVEGPEDLPDEEPEPGEFWDVTVSVTMVPTHGAITDFEQWLAQAAAQHEGQNDGWGCFADE